MRLPILLATFLIINICCGCSPNIRLEDSLTSNNKQSFVKVKNNEWLAPSFLDLRLGKSNSQDVKNKFGKPQWEGHPQEKAFQNDPEDEILIQYFGIKGVGG